MLVGYDHINVGCGIPHRGVHQQTPKCAKSRGVTKYVRLTAAVIERSHIGASQIEQCERLASVT